MRAGLVALAAGLCAALAACATMHTDTAPTASGEAAYAALYPYYAELCAVSEFKKKPGFDFELSSGVGGHAVLYLNGVCRDEHAHYPTVRLCGADTPADQRGVGLSVNAHYLNANWVATPGRDFFYHGTLKPGEALTRESYAQTLARAKAMKIFDGVQFHPQVFDDKPAAMSREDYEYAVSIPTDYAINFGRDRYCARVPMARAAMARIVAYLNDVNAVYKDGKQAFDWDIFRNNCSHLAHNALAIAGVWPQWATEQFFLFALFDFPVPKNEFVNLMRRTNDMPIQDIDAVLDDDAARAALLQWDTLPTRPGSLAEAELVVQDNAVYDTNLSLIFYDEPIFGTYQPHFERIFAEPRYTDLRANLQHFADVYREIERARQPLADFLARHDAATAAKRAALTQFYDRYYGYIDREGSGVKGALAALRDAPVPVAARLP